MINCQSISVIDILFNFGFGGRTQDSGSSKYQYDQPVFVVDKCTIVAEKTSGE